MVSILLAKGSQVNKHPPRPLEGQDQVASGLQPKLAIFLGFDRVVSPVPGPGGVVMLTINDLVLVHLDRQPAFYARINDITPDVKRGWHQVELLLLTLPPQNVTWILDNHHLQGEEFTMGGRPVQLVLVPPKPLPEPKKDETPRTDRGKVIKLPRKS
jgi:hypothetical protein